MVMQIRTEAEKFKDITGVYLPNLLISLYEKRGNGGFGPKYGMLGIVEGHKTDLGDSMFSLYNSFNEKDPEDPNWIWPRELVPFIHLGCAIHLCIDTSHPTLRIIEFDPNGDGPGEKLAEHFREYCPSFEEWINANVQ